MSFWHVKRLKGLPVGLRQSGRSVPGEPFDWWGRSGVKNETEGPKQEQEEGVFW